MANVLITSHAFEQERGGSVRIAHDLARGLNARGHRVTMICEDLYDRKLDSEIVDQIKVLRYRLPRPTSLDPLRHTRHIKATLKIIERYIETPPDIIHGHSLFSYNAAANQYKGRSRGCYTIHSPYIDELRITWNGQGIKGKIKTLFGLSTIRKLELDCLKTSEVLTALSEFTRRSTQFHYGNDIANRIRIIPGWVDLDRFKPISDDDKETARQKLHWPLGRPVFFVLRRLEARMGLENLLRALKIIKQRGYRSHTVIGGSGSKASTLLHLRDDLGLQDEVTFMGFIPYEQLTLAYSACDATVVPTEQLEGFGIITLESLASGRPALVTPVGALPEVMRNFEPEWICAGNTPADIANHLSAFLDGKLPHHEAEELRNIIRDKYSFPLALDSYEKLLMG